MSTESQAALVALSTWIDDGNARRLGGQSWEQLEAEVILLHRTIKVAEELGEAVTNLIGFTGANPRKGAAGTEADILAELLDVAVTALGAYEHIDGNQGRSLAALDEKISSVADRVGLAAAPVSLEAVKAETTTEWGVRYKNLDDEPVYISHGDEDPRASSEAAMVEGDVLVSRQVTEWRPVETEGDNRV